MQGDFELMGLEIKEPACFDEFESFVGHGGGVNGDFCTHRPIGMLFGLLWGDVVELVNWSVSTGSSGSGEDDGF